VADKQSCSPRRGPAAVSGSLAGRYRRVLVDRSENGRAAVEPMHEENKPMTHIATRIAAAEYVAIVKIGSGGPRLLRRAGVVLIIKGVQAWGADRTFFFSSWDFLRERLRVFGFASAKELETAGARISSSKRPYVFSSRRWEAPLIDALNLTCAPTDTE
jgi:hypothetical protein